MSASRTIAFVVNPARSEAVSAAAELAKLLGAEGFTIYTASDVAIPGIRSATNAEIPDIEVAVVLGGDGTILRGAELSLTRGIPLLGINLGHVGFLAEVERPSISSIAECIIQKSYVSEIGRAHV